MKMICSPPDLSRNLKTIPKCRATFPKLSKWNWKGFSLKKRTFPSRPAQKERMYMEIFFFNRRCGIVTGELRKRRKEEYGTHPVLTFLPMRAVSSPPVLRRKRTGLPNGRIKLTYVKCLLRTVRKVFQIQKNPFIQRHVVLTASHISNFMQHWGRECVRRSIPQKPHPFVSPQTPQGAKQTKAMLWPAVFKNPS